MKEVRDRIASVKNTSKITEVGVAFVAIGKAIEALSHFHHRMHQAMKLVAAAKVRRAQEAVISSRPFSENLVKVLFGINQRIKDEDVDSPLCAVRPVKSVLLVVITGDRGLCGGYNNFILKKTEQRFKELTDLGCSVKIVAVGRKVQQYMKRRPKFNGEASSCVVLHPKGQG